MDELDKLYEELKLHNERYYRDNNPIITDKEYDNLVLRIKDLEYKLGVRSQIGVGGSLDDRLKKVNHEYPMLSIDNIFSKEELVKWDKKVKQTIKDNPIINESKQTSHPFYWVELKYDGVSLSLVYEGSSGILSLTQAITRGTGLIGEDVTHNLKYITNIPMTIKVNPLITRLVVRGEVIISRDEFARLNTFLKRSNLPTYSNPRNTASGIIRTLDDIPETPMLIFIAYGVYSHPVFDNRQDMQMLALQINRFSTMSQYSKAISFDKSVDEIMDYYKDINDKRGSLPFDIDGIVVKVNLVANQEIIGYTSRAPKFYMAFKFESEEFRTTLREVLLQVGRTGLITPVALFDPVNINGVTIEKATLHNFDLIKEKDIRIGDEVFVRRAGDVIPEVTKSIPESRIGEEKFVEIAFTCPACKSPIVKRGDRQYYCTGKDICPPQKQGSIEFAVSRDALNIVGLGSAIIANLIALNLIDDISDIYDLKYKDLIKVNHFKDVSILKLLSNIQISRHTSWDKFIYALCIPNVGKSTSKLIAKQLRKLEDLFTLKKEDLLNIGDIGDITADSIVSYCIDNKEKIERLYSKLIIMENNDGSNEFEGINFSITGSFTQPRKVIEEFIYSQGGNMISIGNKTNILIVGNDPSQTKLDKAKKLGVKIIDYIPRNRNDF